MKKIILVLSFVVAIISCKEEAPKDYVRFSGKITNKNSDSFSLRRGYSKKIKVNADGTFSDTLKVKTGIYTLDDGTEITSVYLKNGFDINMTIDAKEFDETVTFTGKGSEASSFLANFTLLQEQEISDAALFDFDSIEFNKRKSILLVKFENLLAGTQNLDSIFRVQQSQKIARMSRSLSNQYKESIYFKAVLAKGKESPKFIDYENFKGGTTSLSDLKGKYVYIDVWATWCKPCKVEIPFLKEVEKEYHGKNIAFVSMSIDIAKNHDKWKEMVKEEGLSGIQLISNNAGKSEFIKAYRVNGIPRFILIDPKGNIVSANAPRPSSKDLKVLFDELKI
ncbi:MAG: TlpA disulfide reductase family protein [Polaribacter sp.]|uniref:TlpA family protein disulfide reductase n=1 Tax=Polaribacter sp. TaxID=1920175 RepID=UPI00326561FF